MPPGRMVLSRAQSHFVKRSLMPFMFSDSNSLTPRCKSGIFTFLFVGSMDYFPNEDGVRFFCAEILPLMRQAATRRFRLVVAGANPRACIRALGKPDEIVILGEVPEVTSSY